MVDKYDKQILEMCLPFLGETPVIFDVGACKGEYTDYVLSKVQKAECFLFEPNSDLFKRLKYKNKYQVALSDKSGQIDFYVCPGKHNELSSIYEREVFKQTGSVKEIVRSTTVDLFCKENEIDFIDFLKIDVEGAEFDVLKGAEFMMFEKKLKFIQVEYGGTYIDAGIKFEDVIEYSKDRGYNVYENGKLVTDFKEDYNYRLFLLTHINYAT